MTAGLKRIDLNLLSVFYAVMAERSVTRAAQRLAMTQPAVSNALRRLRYLFNDELFIKAPDGIRPTEKAIAIWPEIEEALEKIWQVTQPVKFTPGEARLTFNIAVTDSLVSRVTPALATRISAEAPYTRTNFHPHSDPGSRSALERGILDCAVGMFPNPPEDLRRESLFADDYVCVFRRGHPTLGAPMTLDRFVSARHVLVKQATAQIGIVDSWLDLAGRKRDIVMVVNSSNEAVEVTRRTDLAAMIPLSFVQASAAVREVQVAELPFDHPRILYKMVWHERTDRDPARQWLRAVIRETVLTVCAPEQAALKAQPASLAS